MAYESLSFTEHPSMADATMLLGLSGWMDGGDVSTGTIDYLIDHLDARMFAEIDPHPHYILNFPGSMEISALFRPHVRIADGLIEEFELPENEFYWSPDHNVVLFGGKEPNLGWREFADCILHVAAECGVSRVCFIGSVAGTVPHTKEPRFFSSVSDPRLLPTLDEFDLAPSNYEGPASFITYLTTRAREAELDLMTLVAEIPAYVQGRNAAAIESVVRKLDDMFSMSIDFDELVIMRKHFLNRLVEVMDKRPDLAELVEKMEQQYDEETRPPDLDELKEWFENQDFRLD
ncbi:MAG: PAC2 family protein [bacterium]|nr:PAC2 family protein [bacterium]